MPVPLDCPELECWLTLDGGSGPPEQRAAYERHLETCPACQERLDRADRCGEALRRLARQLGDPTTLPPDRTLSQFLERLHEGNSPLRAAPGEPADLYFLKPADRPGVPGTLGGYDVAEVIGQGGMGVVLKAFDPALHRHVAIKVLSPALAVSATARRRFTREAQAAAAVRHDHVVTLHAVAEADGLPYLVMQYVPGESLQERLDRTGPLELTEVVRIGMEAASGLAAAHARGLVHRDIKPANLLLEGEPGASATGGRVKLTDFGLARLVDGVALTGTGVVAGTPEYMAPEQARGEAIDHRADLFSLGSVLFACCAGAPPFRGSTALAVLGRVSEEAPPPLRSLNPGVSAWLEALVARLMMKDPADRPQSAAEVAALLEDYLAHLRQPGTIAAPEHPPAPAGGAPERSRPASRTGPVQGRLRRLGLPGLLVLFLSLSALIVLLLLPEQPSPQEFYQDFRGRPPLPPFLSLFGPEMEDAPDLGQVIRAEDEGLRITVPRYGKQTWGWGVRVNVTLTGDFEITGSYELLAAERPAEGDSVGVALQLAPDTTRPKWAKVGRFLHGLDKDVYEAEVWTRPRSRADYRFRAVPTAARTGQLRLRRQGSILHYLAADGPGGDFREIYQGEFGTDDLEVVRFAANNNRSPTTLDVRLVDLRLRSPGAGTDQAAVAAPSAENRRRPGGWLALGVGIALAALLALAAGLYLRRRPAGQLPAGDGIPATPARAGPAVRPVSVACPACGKRLKATAELVGKKVKCPQCGKAVPVSAGEAGGAAGPC